MPVLKVLANINKKRRDICLRHGPTVWKCKPIPNRTFELPFWAFDYLFRYRYVLALEVKKFRLRKAP
jgi:hypothetical protein